MTRIYLFILLFSRLIIYGQEKTTIDSLNSISHSELVSNLINSEQRFKEVAIQAEAIEYSHGLATAYQHLSIVKYYLKDSEEGLKYSLKAAEIFESIDDYKSLANVYADIGFVIKDIDLSQGLFYFRRAIQISEEYNLTEYQEKFYNNYGTLQQKIPNLDSALYYHQKSLKIATKLDQIGAIPYSLNNIATVLSFQGKFQDALRIMDQSDSLRGKEKNPLHWADNLAYRADIYFEKKDYRQAIEFYQKSLDIAKETQFNNLIQFTLERLSICYEELNNTSEALYFQKQYQSFKDSLESAEKSIALARLQEEFNTAIKDKEIAEKNRRLIKSKLKEEQQRNRVILLVIIILIVLIITLWIYSNQRKKQIKLKQQVKLEKANTVNQIKDEKLRISRDLHDNIGSQLTFVISSLDNLNYIRDKKQREEKLHLLASFTKSTLTELRETIWTIQSQEITISELGAKVAQFINQAKSTFNQLKFETNIEPSNAKLSSSEAVNCFRIIQEAVNNSIKHSCASIISVHISPTLLSVIDNGQGFDIHQNKKGSGLDNLKKRAHDINRKIDIKTSETGTKVYIHLK